LWAFWESTTNSSARKKKKRAVTKLCIITDSVEHSVIHTI
jgi:hypothetical protein